MPPEIRLQWAAFIEHQRIPVVSYPYEWTFGMLRDAALLQLDLVEAAILEGMTLKDATPYNIQFVSGKAVFIDIPSFETLPAGAPWAGYRQFCEMFLFPLMLQAYKGMHFQPLMRSSIDGVGVQTADGECASVNVMPAAARESMCGVGIAGPGLRARTSP